MSNHIIKYDYRDGIKLAKHETETWCGHRPHFSDWLFQDAQHALLSIEQGSLQVPCKKCMAAIIKTAQEVK
ncbi:hypothetical protein ABKV35_00055 [Enterobacter kobei]|uniref:hypothetical protein n=1 Tax=Enterobacter kobei TaxID=208224 RepID=UPI0032AFDF82